MPTSPHLVVTIEHIRLAIPEQCVDDVATSPVITETPLAPATVAGLTNRHGNVVVVVDLGSALGFEERTRPPDPPVVFVETAIGPLGLLVDTIVAPTLVPTGLVQPPPNTMFAPARRLIAGIARLDDQLLAVVDVDAVAAEIAAPVPSIA